MTEEELWEMTPRKFFALLQCALEFNGAKAGHKAKPKQEQTVVQPGYIDQLKW